MFKTRSVAQKDVLPSHSNVIWDLSADSSLLTVETEYLWSQGSWVFGLDSLL